MSTNRTPGVDISHWHPVTNWALLAGAARFVGIKATEGNTNADPTLQQHKRGFSGSGMDLAIYYHLARPGDAVAQAKRFLDAVGPLAPNERVCLDIERGSGVDMPYVEAFYATLREQLGTPPQTPRMLIYASAWSWAANRLGDDWDMAADIDLWAPRYESGGAEPMLPPPWPRWTIWQWSQSAAMPGVDGACDANWFNGSAEDLAVYAAPSGPAVA